MPMYGQAFTLASASEHGLNAPAPRKGQQGEFTRAAGFLAYYEICQKINNEGYTVVHHDEEALGPYAYKGNQWVGYDDIAMIKRKSEFVKENEYGGAMIWALDLDDFNNVCGCERYPLLRTINRVLRNYPKAAPTNCKPGNYMQTTYGHVSPYSYILQHPQQVVRYQYSAYPVSPVASVYSRFYYKK